MKAFFLSVCLLTSTLLNAQSLNPFFQTIVAGVKYDTVLNHLQRFESFGTKSPSSAALRNTATWLCDEYASYGYTEVVRDTFSYDGNTLFNIVVTKTGTLYPNKYLILSGHYDTQSGPGTNDNGSGVSIILEVARLMQSIPTEYSVKFINFSAEESGLLGSAHYVDHTVVPGNLDILLVFNIDEVGGVAGETNNTVTCEYDNGFPSANNATSQDYTDSLSTLTSLYSALLTNQASAYGSDYLSFEDNGEIITGYYESNESTWVHSSSDNLSHLDTSYVVELARAATGASLYFARAYEVFTGVPIRASEGYKIFPNPAHSVLTVSGGLPGAFEFTIYNVNGARMAQFQCAEPTLKVDISILAPAIYYYTILGTAGGRMSQGKIVVIR